MTIRLRLLLSLTLLFSLAFGGLGYGLVSLQKRRLFQDGRERAQIIERTLERAARDALLQKDDVLLISYVKFLREQFPALSYCRVQWEEGSRVRTVSVGDVRSAGEGVFERPVLVRDPSDGTRRAVLFIGIDGRELDRRTRQDVARISRDILRLFGVALIMSAIFSFWFAGRLTRPLVGLSQAAAQIAKGKLGVRLAWHSKDEIGALVDSFNNMSARLEALDAMKKDFISSVTHELRSPLGAITSFLNLLETKAKSGAPADVQQFWDYFHRIQANVHRLSGFISDLLDVAKIERGKMECHLRGMRIQDVADEVVQFFEAKSREQGVTLSNRLDRALLEVQADPERIRQVLVNLLSNALKFTPSGGSVWIQGELYREGESRFLEVAVVDTGRGMDEQDLRGLFQKFQQGKNVQGGVQGHKGTGLGLFIVKNIVEAHGGKVTVRSAPGKGTQFLFTLKMS
ncbi:MAG: HAMP domain-containing sensor histidine kinase [Elusimicrobiota bacterium]|jgi:signal transduction histidine kinase